MNSISKHKVESYVWGNHCLGYVLIHHPEMTIKQETIPFGSGEVNHVHQHTQQFFYVLSGKATLQIEDETFELSVQEGMHIPAGMAHRISNQTLESLEILVISTPGLTTDRLNLS